VPRLTAVAVGIAAVVTIAVGVYPQWLLDATDVVSQYAR